MKLIKFIKNYFVYFCYTLASFFILSFFESCALETDPLEGKQLIQEIKTDLDTNTIWNRATIYVIKKPNFKVNKTLIIQSGAIIKFDPDSGRSMTITAEGHITAQGTLSKPIVFTSLLDPRNLSEDEIAKNNTLKAGTWDMIKIESKLPCVFNLCNFYFGGGGSNKSTIDATDSAIISITYCNFVFNDGGNIELGSGVINASKVCPKSFLRNNLFYHNNLPLCVNPNLTTDDSNSFFEPKDSAISNTYNIILVRNDDHVTGVAEWNESEVAYVIWGPNLILEPEASLLIGNEVTVKFPKNGSMILKGKNTCLRNYDGPNVLFTSIFDDSSKGDSNADGSATKPANGDWKGVTVTEPDLFDWTNFRYFSQKK